MTPCMQEEMADSDSDSSLSDSEDSQSDMSGISHKGMQNENTTPQKFIDQE